MKQIAITIFLFLFAHIVISQQYPNFYNKSDKADARLYDPFAGLPVVGKQYSSLDGRTLHHTQLDSSKYWTWVDSLNAWSFDGQSNFSYSPNSEIVLSLDQQLENQYLENFQYDDNGNLLEYIFQYWTGSSWMNSSRYTYAYDDNDNVVELIYQSSSGGSFENILRYVYTYNGNGDLVELLAQDWLANVWADNFRLTFTYNANHQQVEVLQEGWQFGWGNQFLHTFTYGSNNELVTELFEEWVGDWQIKGETTYTYDDELRLIEQEIDVYDSGLYVGQTKIFYTYDDQDNVIIETSQNTDSGQLENTTRQLNEYDDENNLISNVFQFWVADWLNYDSSHYYWNPVTSVSDDSSPDDGLVVFPNPASDELQLKLEIGGKFDSYEIQSLDGKVVQRARIVSNQPIKITGLPDGMYVLRLHQDRETIAQQRFIKM